MTKLLIGLGLLTVAGALFGALLTLWGKLFPLREEAVEEKPAGETQRLWAVVHCTGGGAGFSKYNYQGAQDCLAASLVPGGGPLSCAYGCLGMGTCAKVCPEGAIQVRDGAARVDGERCTACGACVAACPRHIITLEPVSPQRHVTVPCSSRDREEQVSDLCTDGCIGCSLCVKACPREAVSVEEGLARIDYEKCDSCGKCVEACPRHLIAVEAVPEPPKPEPPKPPKERKKPKHAKENRPSKRLLPKRKEEGKEEKTVEEKAPPEIDIPLDGPAPEEQAPLVAPAPGKAEPQVTEAPEPSSEEQTPDILPSWTLPTPPML